MECRFPIQSFYLFVYFCELPILNVTWISECVVHSSVIFWKLQYISVCPLTLIHLEFIFVSCQCFHLDVKIILLTSLCYSLSLPKRFSMIHFSQKFAFHLNIRNYFLSSKIMQAVLISLILRFFLFKISFGKALWYIHFRIVLTILIHLSSTCVLN